MIEIRKEPTNEEEAKKVIETLVWTGLQKSVKKEYKDYARYLLELQVDGYSYMDIWKVIVANNNRIFLLK